MLLVDAIGFVIVLILLGGGLWFLGWSLWEILLARDSTRWPVTTGTITVSQVVSEEDQVLGTIFHWRTYRPDVHYRYQIGGQQYDGARVLFSQRWLTRAAAEALAQPYRPGRPVVVHHHPVRPSLAVLQPDISWPGLGYQVCIGVALYFVGAFIALVLFHW